MTNLQKLDKASKVFVPVMNPDEVFWVKVTKGEARMLLKSKKFSLDLWENGEAFVEART